MKYFIVIGFFISSLLFGKIPDKYAVSKNCAVCHLQKAKDWRTTWHSRSHISKNPLYKKVLDFLSHKHAKFTQQYAVSCGQCHNPRMEIKSVNDNDQSLEYAKLLGIHMKVTEKVNKALDNKTVKEGISCIVCHNIKKIKNSKNINDRGYKDIIFGPPNVMVGPFKESNRPVYHKMMQGSHFLHKNVNKICFICHYGYKKNGHFYYKTGIEYKKSKSNEKCVDCHMGKPKVEIVAPNINNKSAVARVTRRHLFKAARNSDILKHSLKISTSVNNGILSLKLINITPHNVPTGFSGRSIVIAVQFKKSKKILKKYIKKITMKYIDQNNNETLSYDADKLVFDNRFKPNETKIFNFSIPSGSNDIVINIYYRLIKKSLVSPLKIKDPIFLKKYPIYYKDINL